MDELEFFLVICLAGFSALIFSTAIIATKRLKSVRLTLVSAAFFVFFITGCILSVFGFLNIEINLKIILVPTLIALLLLYTALLKE